MKSTVQNRRLHLLPLFIISLLATEVFSACYEDKISENDSHVICEFWDFEFSAPYPEIIDHYSNEEINSEVETVLPECSGIATADLGSRLEYCPSHWINGEQMCPQTVWCGVIILCMAYSNWPEGSCTCAEPPRDVCCPISIIEPVNGTVIRMNDDLDPTTDGIQIAVTVNTDCWRMELNRIFLSSCGGLPAFSERQLDIDINDRATGIVDLEETEGCVDMCAEVRSYETVIAYDSVKVCVEL